MADLFSRWQPLCLATRAVTGRNLYFSLHHSSELSRKWRRKSRARRFVLPHLHMLQRRVIRSSQLHTSIYEDGYGVLHNFFTESELAALNSISLQSSMLKGQRGQLLSAHVGEVVKVELGMNHLQNPGFKCTDGATSPEPWWEHMWEVVEVDIDDRWRLNPDCKTATIVVSCTDGTVQKCGGGLAVFPRSHWLNADWLWATSDTTGAPSLPKAFDVPAATLIELNLACGDAVLLHPLLAWSLAPNISKCSTHFLFLNIYTSPSKTDQHSESKVMQMWQGWTALASQYTKDLTTFHLEEVKLIEEEMKAIQGGWALVANPGDMPELPSFYSYVTPHDRLSWQLRSCINKSMQEEKWDEAMAMLQRLAGLCPKSYWVVYHAGCCCTLSAPRGQLAGRAGRKSRLEDAERFLLRAVEMAPGWPLAYAELARVLLLLGRGREEEIPDIFNNMKRRCDFDQLCSKYSMFSDELKKCQEKWRVILSTLSAPKI